MTEKLLNILKDKYKLQEIEVGDMKKLRANGMKFDIKAYHAEGLGHVSIMKANGFFGLMKMDTLIVNPQNVDLPLYSYDRIYAMGNDTLIVELYDTMLNTYSQEEMERVKENYTDLLERDPGEHWYDNIKLSSSISKKGKKAQEARFDELALEHFQAYLVSETSEVSDVLEKQKKASYYVEGLLEKGGPSTDVFKKSIGEEKTAELFRKYLFGTMKESISYTDEHM